MRGHVIRCLGALSLGLAVGCGDGGRGGTTLSTTSIGTDGEESSTAGDGDGDGDKLDALGDGDGDGDGDGECEAISKTAENKLIPADILFVIDNSGSMDLENNWVAANMNGFSQQIFLANIEAHVVVISSYPDNDGLCVDEPLGNGGCPLSDTNPPIFLHIDDKVGSNDPLIKLLNNYANWKDTFRDESVKHLVVVSDDESDMDAGTFDTMFKALEPDFSDYVFHAIVASQPPFIPPCTFISAARGQVYIDLADATGGVFGDLCDQDFKPVFDAISEKVQTEAPLACEWDIPEPPEGQMFDPEKVNVEFTVNGMTTEIGHVDDPADCQNVSDGWYYDDPNMPTKILFCPQTCAKVQNAMGATIDIKFGCATKPAG